MVEHSVLIIDDDPWMQRVFSRIMLAEGFRKYHVASDGYVGIAMAIEHKPTLILLDIIMPELNGCQVLKIIKNINLIQSIPTIIASTTPNPTNISVAMKLGAAGFIVKPFTSATVHEKLLKLFGENGLSCIRQGKELDDMPYHDGGFEEEFDIADDNTEFDIENFKMKQQEDPNISIPGEKTGFTKTGPTINKDILKVHYQTDKEQNAKELEEMLSKFKYKD